MLHKRFQEHLDTCYHGHMSTEQSRHCDLPETYFEDDGAASYDEAHHISSVDFVDDGSIADDDRGPPRGSDPVYFLGSTAEDDRAYIPVVYDQHDCFPCGMPDEAGYASENSSSSAESQPGDWLGRNDPLSITDEFCIVGEVVLLPLHHEDWNLYRRNNARGALVFDSRRLDSMSQDWTAYARYRILEVFHSVILNTYIFFAYAYNKMCAFCLCAQTECGGRIGSTMVVEMTTVATV